MVQECEIRTVHALRPLFSLGSGEWVMLQEAIPIAEYEELTDQFKADRFDADYVPDLPWSRE